MQSYSAFWGDRMLFGQVHHITVSWFGCEQSRGCPEGQKGISTAVDRLEIGCTVNRDRSQSSVANPRACLLKIMGSKRDPANYAFAVHLLAR